MLVPCCLKGWRAENKTASCWLVVQYLSFDTSGIHAKTVFDFKGNVKFGKKGTRKKSRIIINLNFNAERSRVKKENHCS